jgi:hypothetical protein
VRPTVGHVSERVGVVGVDGDGERLRGLVLCRSSAPELPARELQCAQRVAASVGDEQLVASARESDRAHELFVLLRGAARRGREFRRLFTPAPDLARAGHGDVARIGAVQHVVR